MTPDRCRFGHDMTGRGGYVKHSRRVCRQCVEIHHAAFAEWQRRAEERRRIVAERLTQLDTSKD